MFRLSVIFLFIIIEGYRSYAQKLYVELPSCKPIGSGATGISIPKVLTLHSHLLEYRLEFSPLICDKKDVAIDYFSITTAKKFRSGDFGIGFPYGYDKYFYSDGTISIGKVHYNKRDYCIKRILPNSLIVKLCNYGCNPSTRCIPKCCPMDRIFDVDKDTCTYTVPSNKWSPHVFSNDDKNMNYSKALEHSLTTQMIHYQTKPISYCGRSRENPIKVTLRNLTSRGIRNGLFRILSNGSTLFWKPKPIGKWLLVPFESYCVDGIQNFGLSPSQAQARNHLDQILFVCPQILVEPEMITPIVYGVSMLLSCTILLITLTLYFLLRDKQKFHMWVVAAYIFSLLFLNISFGTSNIISQLRISNDQGSIGCIIVGAASHLFVLSTFLWLTMINLNIWFTFRLLTNAHSSLVQKYGVKRFILVLMISWGIPLIVILIGIILDNIPATRNANVSPRYGNGRCLISIDAEGFYFFYPIGALIICNIGIFVVTIARILIYQKLTRHLIGSSSDKQWKIIRIYGLLLITGTVLWLIEVIVWYFQLDSNSWYWASVDLLNIVQSIIILISFIGGRNVLESLEVKYPIVRQASSYFRSKTYKSNSKEKERLISQANRNQNDNQTPTPTPTSQ